LTKITQEQKQKEFGEVFTPPALVVEILDRLPLELWSDENKTWLDNSCGDGAFLVQVKARLMTGLAEKIPNDGERERHILEHQIYGVELQADNWEACRRNLGLTPTGNDGNIVCADALRYDYKFRKDPNGGYIVEYPKELEPVGSDEEWAVEQTEIKKPEKAKLDLVEDNNFEF
jgi:type I restriction-modification system DNA methylase subunit